MILLDVDKVIRPMLLKLAKEEQADCIEDFVLHYVKQRPFYTRELEECCKNLFRESVQAICVRACIEDIHERKTGWVYDKDNKEDILETWCQKWKDKELRQRFIEMYPVLKECMDEVIINTAIHFLQFLERFERDKKQIEEQLLHKKIRKITNIETNLSDAHNGGTSVIKVELDASEYLIYKPHALDNETWFYAAAHILGDKIGLDFYSPKILCREDYGWETCVEQKSCETEEQVHRYYKRIGVLLFLAYVLKSSDLHMENLIAHGEYPVFVDMEALFTPLDGLDGKDINECITAFLQQSVMSTGILPFYHWNKENRGVNLSALSHEEMQELPVRIPTVADKGTLDMRITYKYGKVYPAKNQVKLGDKKVIPDDYVKDVLDGFCQIYKAALGCKKELKTFFEGFSELYSRYLVADTQKYSMLISLSYHPDFLHDKKKRDELFDILWKFNIRKKEYADVIHRCEKEDLLHGDVPVFHVKYDSRHLYFHDEIVVMDYTDKTAGEFVAETIAALSEKDMMQQCMVIETSMSFPKVLREMDCKKESGYITTDCEKEALIKKGLNHILEQAIYTKDKAQIGWISPQVVGKEVSRFMLYHGGMYLYDGLAGMFVLFCEAVYKMGYREYEEVYKKIEAQMFYYTDALMHELDTAEELPDTDSDNWKNLCKCQSHHTGFLNGESSIVVAYLQAYRMTQDGIYLQMAQKHAKVVYHLLQIDENDDFLDGKAGAVLMFLEVYKLTQDDKYIRYACEAEALLHKNAQIAGDEMCWIQKTYGIALLGMAHGTAGILLAYGKLYEVTQEQQYLDSVEKILRYEHRRYNEQTGDWHDYRKQEEEQAVQAAAWCHGAGGILLSRIALVQMSLPKAIKDMILCDISRAVKKLRKSYMRNSYCLCHGVSGNVLIMERYVEYLKDQSGLRDYIYELEKLCKQIRECIYECVRKDQQELLRETYGMGLMSGYGGIIYSMMKR